MSDQQDLLQDSLQDSHGCSTTYIYEYDSSKKNSSECIIYVVNTLIVELLRQDELVVGGGSTSSGSSISQVVSTSAPLAVYSIFSM